MKIVWDHFPDVITMDGETPEGKTVIHIEVPDLESLTDEQRTAFLVELHCAAVNRLINLRVL
jgi:hypothetical protein